MNKRSKNFLNYVSVSSFDKKQEANILIRIPEDEKEIKGALRFNYMIPVPEECIERLVIKDVEDEMNITVRRSRQSGVARATCPD